MDSNALIARIIACIIRVHQALGPGFLEYIYRRALLIELRRDNLAAEIEREFGIYYEGERVGVHRIDILVEGQVIVELKTVEALGKTQYAQVRSYLKATNLDLALLVNFATPRADFRRVRR